MATVRSRESGSCVDAIFYFVFLSTLLTTGLWVARHYVEFPLAMAIGSSIGILFALAATYSVLEFRMHGRKAAAWNRRGK